MNFCLRVPGNAEKGHKNIDILVLPLLHWMNKFMVPMYMHLSLQKAELSPLEMLFMEIAHTCRDRHIPQGELSKSHSFAMSSFIKIHTKLRKAMILFSPALKELEDPSRWITERYLTEGLRSCMIRKGFYKPPKPSY